MPKESKKDLMDDLTYKMDVAAPRDQVWDAWTTADGLTSWLCLRANVSPIVGGVYELFWNPDESQSESNSTIGCRVLSIDCPRLLQFTWRGSDEVADVMNVAGVQITQVKVELFPTLNGTRLEVTHSGWGEGAGWDRARNWFDRAWSNALEKLRVTVTQVEEIC